MNRLKTYLKLCAIQSLFAVSLFSQNATVYGVVTDQGTGLPLLFANVQCGPKGAVADLDGTYKIEIDPGTFQVVFSYVGYAPHTESVSLAAGESLELNIALSEEVNVLQTATVTSGKFEKPLGEVTVSLEVLKPGLIENTSKPTLDEALQKIPGVTVIDVQRFSPWLYLFGGFLALFMVLGKRRHELVLLGQNADSHRAILKEYNLELIDRLLGIVTTSAVVSYSLYTFLF